VPYGGIPIAAAHATTAFIERDGLSVRLSSFGSRPEMTQVYPFPAMPTVGDVADYAASIPPLRFWRANSARWYSSKVSLVLSFPFLGRAMVS
jgi:hypothetical protein